MIGSKARIVFLSFLVMVFAVLLAGEYYGIAGNFRALQRMHRTTERYWRKMLSSRSHKGHITWEVFQRIKERYPLQRSKLYLPYRELQAIAVL